MKITQKQREKLNKIGKEHNIKLAMIIGSRTEKGSPKPDSDLDIAFILNDTERKKHSFYDEFLNELSAIFPTQKINPINLKNKNFLFNYKIRSDAELIIGKEMDYLEFKARSFREFIDYKEWTETHKLRFSEAV